PGAAAKPLRRRARGPAPECRTVGRHDHHPRPGAAAKPLRRRREATDGFRPRPRRYDDIVAPDPRPAPLTGNIGTARFFRSYLLRARKLLRDPAASAEREQHARSKATGASNSGIRELGERIKLLGRLVRAYANG